MAPPRGSRSTSSPSTSRGLPHRGRCADGRGDLRRELDEPGEPDLQSGVARSMRVSKVYVTIGGATFIQDERCSRRARAAGTRRRPRRSASVSQTAGIRRAPRRSISRTVPRCGRLQGRAALRHRCGRPRRRSETAVRLRCKGERHVRCRFVAAGTYAYVSTVKADKPSVFSGAVAVAPVVAPTTGGTTTSFDAKWARAVVAGCVFDVQYRFRPAGSTKWKDWTPWQKGVTHTACRVHGPAEAREGHVRIRGAAPEQQDGPGVGVFARRA